MNDRTEHPTERSPAEPPSAHLAPPDYSDPVIEVFKRDVDRTLLRENLKLSVEERLRKAERLHASVAAWREAGRQLTRTGAGDVS